MQRTIAPCSQRLTTIATLWPPRQARSLRRPQPSRHVAQLRAGPHFILVKPITPDQAQATLRAATSLLKRERRQSFRVPVQAPVSLRTEEAQHIEGILLDVSSGGMDVLSAKPFPSATLTHFSFDLPYCHVQVEGDAEVAWSSANGQTGLRFLDMDPRMREQLGDWLTEHAQEALPEEADPVSHCKLTDLSLGGC